MKLIGWEEERKVIVVSWTDKALKKAKIHKMIDQAMNSPQYKKARQEDMEQSALKAYIRFCLVTLDYLELKHGYKKNGMMNFVKFAADRMNYIANDDEAYFDEMNKHFVEEFGIDAIAALGFDILKDGEPKEGHKK